MGRYFSYSWTCPDIDKNIREFQSMLSDSLDDIILELSPMFANTTEKTNYRNLWEEAIYDEAEKVFENVRECNSNIRNEAEKQLESVIDERDEYKRLYEEAQDKISELQSQVENLEEIIIQLSVDELNNAK